MRLFVSKAIAFAKDSVNPDADYISRKTFLLTIAKLKRHLKNNNKRIEELRKRTERVSDKIRSLRDLWNEVRSLFSARGYSTLLRTSSLFGKVLIYGLRDEDVISL